MDLRLYDTLSREKRTFAPLDPNNVRMYVCGPTVYDYAHIGNARPVIVFDVLFRLLRHLYGADHVTYVRNITDVDDKINDRAARDFAGLPLNEAIRKVTEVTATQFASDVAALGSLPPTFQPRATDFVLPRTDGKTDMVTLIRQLIARGHAYEAGGEVLFDTASMLDYGALSGRKLDEQRPGARVAVDAHKKSPLDFVLWKQSSGDEPGWESPWGRGRPGWHIECSAMSEAYLGDVFDIHGGGIDLIFPHHENELAQSRCAHGTRAMANYWMHNGFLQVEGEKMSKSLGNFVTIRELRRTRKFGGRSWNGRVLKFAMLQTHYRQPIDWSARLLEQSEVRLNRWRDFAAEHTLRKTNKRLFQTFIDAISDDLNTPEAFAIVDSTIRGDTPTDEDRYTVYRILRFLGLGARQTRVAKTAAQLGRLVESVESISPDEWSHIDFVTRNADRQQFFEVKSHPELELVSVLDAFADYWNSLNIESKLPGELSVNSGEQRYLRSRDLRLLADGFRRRMRDLGCFSTSDWDKFFVTAIGRPRFKSGSLKPEAQLLTYMRALATLGKSHKPAWNSHFQEFLNYKRELLKEAEPASNEFEKGIRLLIADRESARKEGRYADADRIRDQLAAMGVVIKDSKEGTTWEIAR